MGAANGYQWEAAQAWGMPTPQNVQLPTVLTGMTSLSRCSGGNDKKKSTSRCLLD